MEVIAVSPSAFTMEKLYESEEKYALVLAHLCFCVFADRTEKSAMKYVLRKPHRAHSNE